MDNYRKQISLTLALFFVLSAISCQSAAGGPDTAGTDVTTSEETTAESAYGRAGVRDDLPGTLDLGGRTVRILARSGDWDTKVEFIAGEESGELVEDAVYKRNLRVMERLNCSIDMIEVADERHSGAKANELLKASVLAGSDDYDLVANHMGQITPLILQGMFLNLKPLPYLDWDKPWWNSSYNDTVTLDGKQYMCAGELASTMISGTYVTFFNKRLWDEYGEGDLYEIVGDGGWTLDAMNRYAADLYVDLNGDTVADEGDLYGMVFNSGSIQSDGLAAGANLAFSEFENGAAKWALENERTADFLSKLNTLIYSSKGTYIITALENIFQTTLLDKLRNDTSLFTIHILSGTEMLRDMKGDYGIIPMPKLDESQKDYTTTVHNGFSVFAIPATANKAEEIAPFLEAMCAESYRTVTPAYYDVALKVKYARDEMAGEMLDLSISGIRFDFAYLFNQSIGENGTLFRGILSASTNIEKGISTIASKKSEVETKFADIIKTYGELE